MIQRDNRSVSECGVHMIGPDGIGRAGCPLCRAMVDEARAESGERRMTIGDWLLEVARAEALA